MKYEVICEIFSNCSGKARPFFEEVDGTELEEYIKQRTQGEASYERTDLPDGSIIYNIDSHGIRERFTFTPALGKLTAFNGRISKR